MGRTCPTDPGYASINTGVESQMVSSHYAADKEQDLAARVKALEAALKTMNDKAAADAKKKASQPTFAVGGLINYDTFAFGNEDLKNSGLLFNNGGEIRRLRLQVAGEAFCMMDYKLEVDFASTSRPSMKDIYFTIKELPYVQNVRFGHFKEPFGLEQLTSDRFTTFMERSMVDDGGFIVPSRNLGTMAFGWTENERATWAMGCFITDIVDNPVIYSTSVLPSGVTALDDKPQTAVTMRGTFLPWYYESNDTLGLWHLGGAYSYRATEGYRNGANPVVANYSIRPEAHLAPAILGTNALPTVDTQLMGFETAVVYGPLSLQGEYFLDFVDRAGNRSNLTYIGRLRLRELLPHGRAPPLQPPRRLSSTACGRTPTSSACANPTAPSRPAGARGKSAIAAPMSTASTTPGSMSAPNARPASAAASITPSA